MNKMTVGVWIKKDYRPEEGGGYSYHHNLITGLDNYEFADGIELVFVSTSIRTQLQSKKKHIQIAWEDQSVKRVLRKLASFAPFIGSKLTAKIDTVWNRTLKNELRSNGVDILYYPSQMDLVLPDFPYICTNWDIGHLNTFSFPEMINENTINIRNDWYYNILPSALRIFVESNAGKNELIQFLSIPEKNIHVVPMFTGEQPSEQFEDLSKFPEVADLSDQSFFFYPAQFWSHKNHIRLLQAFKQVTTDHPNIHLILTGSDKGNLESVRNEIDKLDLGQSVRILGFVESSLIDALYQNAVALVMPTFLGPTNLPLLEAMRVNCPVACSDFIGHREMLEDAALYFNPSEMDDMAASLKSLLREEQRTFLIQEMRSLRHHTKFNIDHALNEIDRSLQEIASIPKNWN